MHAMLNQGSPKDYVIGTGTSHSVAEFVAHALFEINRARSVEGALERLDEYVEFDPRLLRTGEIHDLRADARVAERELGWRPAVGFKELVGMMVEADVAGAEITMPDETVSVA